MNIVDGLILVVFVYHGMSGLNNGFILSFFSLIGWILSYYAAKHFYPIFSQYIIEHTEWLSKVQAYIGRRIEQRSGGLSRAESMDGFLNLLKLPEGIKHQILNNGQLQDQATGIGEALGFQLSYLFINLVSMILVFMAARFIISIVVQIINALAQLPILRQLNRGFGFVFGIFKGVLMLYVIFALLTPVITMSPEGVVADKTTSSLLGNYFYEHNIIMNYLSTLIS